MLVGESLRHVGDDWVWSRKHDGIRVLYQDGALFSRTGLFIMWWYEPVPPGMVLDGELCTPEHSTHTSVNSALQTGKKLHVFWFDVYRLDLRFDERYRLLQTYVPAVPQYRLMPGWDQYLLEISRRYGWEGVVIRRRDGLYRPGHRSVYEMVKHKVKHGIDDP
jgi:ATP-dependent DNA ligase